MGLLTRFKSAAAATFAAVIATYSAVTLTYAAATDTLSTDAPAGGSGATGGAYDNATNRDAMIVTVNALNATVASMLLAQAKLAADGVLLNAAVAENAADVAALIVATDAGAVDVASILTAINAGEGS